MQSNTRVRRAAVYTNEGQRARNITPELQLRRLVMNCLLFEQNFYMDGKKATELIQEVLPLVNPRTACLIAVEARTKMNLRHVPMLIAYYMTLLPTHKGFVGQLLPEILRRADELSEFLALYWAMGGKSLSAQTKKGLAAAALKFDEYSLAKYDREAKEVRLRDVIFLTHPKAGDDMEKGSLLARLVNKDRFPEVTKSGFPVKKHYKLKGENPGLATPETWEVMLSARPAGYTDAQFAEYKKGVFTDLMLNKKLFGLAFLRNLRNMVDVGVDRNLIRIYMEECDFSKVLPFRFLAAARAVPGLEDVLEVGMLRALASAPKLPGRTVLLVDVSPSMAQARVSSKSELTRKDAALALAMLMREVCEEVEVVAFSNDYATVPPRRGFSLGDAISRAVASNGTRLGHAVAGVSGKYDRLVVFTDEESQDPVGNPDEGKKAYMVNVAVSRYGVGYGKWTHVDGFSEAVIEFIRLLELEGLDG